MISDSGTQPALVKLTDDERELLKSQYQEKLDHARKSEMGYLIIEMYERKMSQVWKLNN